uniref:Uncharacterized protein n=1 Tax=Panagrolaimus sp. PS1159 TaxID=55785 RepID=A0AC35G9Y9_9BILA
MSFFGSIKKRLSKAAHAATEQIFSNGFQNCQDLLKTNKLSIKLNIDYETLNARNQQLARQGRFVNIPFLIRDEKRQKITLLNAAAEAENGISISTKNGNLIMYVRPPNNTENCLGKLMNPTPATLFKIMKQSNSHEFLVQSTFSTIPILKIERLNNFMGKLITVVGADCAYCFKRMDNTILGYIRPKLCRSSNTLIIKFDRTNTTDVQIRAIILGIASLFVITEAYPEIGQMLSKTLKMHHS